VSAARVRRRDASARSRFAARAHTGPRDDVKSTQYAAEKVEWREKTLETSNALPEPTKITRYAGGTI